MQELFSGAFREVPDGMLGDAILEMSIRAAKGESLIALLACLLKSVVFKTPIIAVIMLDCYSVLDGELFECLFCFYRFFR
jgi:hypothetical protein